jgi:hypothetical protein
VAYRDLPLGFRDAVCDAGMMRFVGYSRLWGPVLAATEKYGLDVLMVGWLVGCASEGDGDEGPEVASVSVDLPHRQSRRS